MPLDVELTADEELPAEEEELAAVEEASAAGEVEVASPEELFWATLTLRLQDVSKEAEPIPSSLKVVRRVKKDIRNPYSSVNVLHTDYS